MIMRHSLLFIIVFAAMALSSCSDDFQQQSDGDGLLSIDEGELSEVALNLTVNPFTVDAQAGTRASEPSDTPEEATADENYIHDIWVFQYDDDTEKLLIRPRYYVIESQDELDDLPVQLKADTGTKSVVYIVANVGNDKWADNGTDSLLQTFSTLSKLREQVLPEPEAIQFGKDEILIPMGGSDTVEVKSREKVTVPVTRMYAKIKIKVNIYVDGMEPYDVNIKEIPWYCKIESLENGKDEHGEPEAVDFPEGTDFVSRAFAASDNEVDEKGWTVIYVPETLRGETDANDKREQQPDNALAIDVTTSYGGGRLTYTVYPGGNTTNNFNIQRNCVYRVTVNIKTIEDSQHQPSANCFIVKPNDLLAFEPYYRVETGGGYSFSDYLNPEVEKLTIDKLEIIWQTKDCIGDNTKGDLVRLEDAEKPDLHQKIYVKTNKKGNALIAARNKDGEIIWSWHIWVTDNEPDNLGKAVVYTTYGWNRYGINTSRRVPGYAVMSCNLGAMADYPKAPGVVEGSDVFGMLYQWGRKDPFPPMKKIDFDPHNYATAVTGEHYGNDNKTVVEKTSYTEPSGYLFHSVIGSTLKGAVRYSIANPTVFICGTNDVKVNYNYVHDLNNYFNNGDWCPVGESSDSLWGGISPDLSNMEYLTVSASDNIHIFDNYGVKSIFDPCPKGWRVAPGELWLEFSSTGLNPQSEAQINYDRSHTVSGYGMMMYMRDWRKGDTSFFPTQGTRVGDGAGIRVGVCGNYHNATTDVGNRVNILHIHDDYTLFHIFEGTYPMYYVKSTAGPIRCVRDSK